MTLVTATVAGVGGVRWFQDARHVGGGVGVSTPDGLDLPGIDDPSVPVVAGDRMTEAATAEEPARRIALDRRIAFPVPVTSELVLADNFSGGHRGVDLWRADAASGHPLIACVDGVLVERNENEGRQGNSWVLQASDGYAFRYHHLDEFEPGLELGSEVKIGDVLGTMGSTGNAGGPHLHFEVRPSGPIGTAVDPMEYLSPPPDGVAVL